MPADQTLAQSLELSAGHSYPPRLGIAQKCRVRIFDRLPSRFFWLLIYRLKFDGFLLGRLQELIAKTTSSFWLVSFWLLFSSLPWQSPLGVNGYNLPDPPVQARAIQSP